ncbi:MAG: hypothetical protein ABI564_13555 [Ideonella sp.]
MRHSSTRPSVNPLNPKRAATPMIALSAFVAAWILMASEPAVGESIDAIGNGDVLVAALSNPEHTIQPSQIVQPDHPRGTPLFGEISSIEPIKKPTKASANGATVGGSVTGFRVHIRLDNGSSRSIDRKSLDGLDVGSRVRIQNGSLQGA